MEQFEKQGGISFFIIFYSQKNLFYYLRFSLLSTFWERAQNGGRKSFRLEELEPEYFMEKKQGVFVPYLDYLSKDLQNR